MSTKPIGVTVLAGSLFVAGGVGAVAFAAAFLSWLTIPGISPLAALVSLVWSTTFATAAALTWRRSRHAPRAFLVAATLLAPVAFFIFPGGYVLVLASLAVVVTLALLGYRYLDRAELAA